MSLLPDFLYEEGEEGEAAREIVIEKVGGLAVFLVVLLGNTSFFLWVLITADTITNIIRSIMRIIIRIVGRIVIVEIIIKPISTELEREDK